MPRFFFTIKTPPQTIRHKKTTSVLLVELPRDMHLLKRVRERKKERERQRESERERKRERERKPSS